MKTLTTKQRVLNYFTKNRNSSVDKACKNLKMTKSNLLSWLWCLDNRDHLLARFIFKGEIKILAITK